MSRRGLYREAMGTAGAVPAWRPQDHGRQVALVPGHRAEDGAVAALRLRTAAAAGPRGPGLLAYLQDLLGEGPADPAERGGFVRGYLQRGETWPQLRAMRAPARLLPAVKGATRPLWSPGHPGRRAEDSLALRRRVPAFMPRRRAGASGGVSHYRYIGHLRRR